ncbi:lipoate--protein ligase [Facklamia miroungae]|uniref:lipoate--protein ligase n=1 Tax=Facklamia miroungae TaxID=120956 RepID=A0A1G7SVW5_9LACT|nr:lipoate--protein ligase [Facklamia miroungae]NKZ29517.1 lipoate--protein ligase [Facklamia miroungae]SDG27098.1 lipoate-protein ligase A [Facklamia miroungae]
MYFVDNENNYDASVNIALETYLVENRLVDEPILLFYINEPSIIIGRNQNTFEEINQAYVDEHNIRVVRRMSGGGAVYHDLGNFSFCFIKDDDGSFRDFKAFTQPVIDALHKMGASSAELLGRNDLLVDGKKFSGNAMYAKRGRMTAHGTILFDSDLDEVNNALKPNKAKYESKGVKSVRSRVTNLKPYVDDKYKELTTEQFRDLLLLEIFGVEKREDVKEYHLTKEDWEKVYQIREERFGNWDWNFGHSPKFDIQASNKFPFGFVDMRFNIKDAMITDTKIYGDFFGLGEIEDLENALTGVKFERQSILEVLQDMDLKKYLGNVEAEELVEMIFS